MQCSVTYNSKHVASTQCFRRMELRNRQALDFLFLLQVLVPGLGEAAPKRKRILSPEELEDRKKKRQEAAARRERLIEEKKKKKEEAEHKKKYVRFTHVTIKLRVTIGEAVPVYSPQLNIT